MSVPSKRCSPFILLFAEKAAFSKHQFCWYLLRSGLPVPVRNTFLFIRYHSVIFCDKHKWMKAGMMERWTAPFLPLTQTPSRPGCLHLHYRTLNRRQTSGAIWAPWDLKYPHWIPVTLLLVIQCPRGVQPPTQDFHTNQSVQPLVEKSFVTGEMKPRTKTRFRSLIGRALFTKQSKHYSKLQTELAMNVNIHSD